MANTLCMQTTIGGIGTETKIEAGADQNSRIKGCGLSPSKDMPKFSIQTLHRVYEDKS
jgi:hypothetical protein